MQTRTPSPRAGFCGALFQGAAATRAATPLYTASKWLLVYTRERGAIACNTTPSIIPSRPLAPPCKTVTDGLSPFCLCFASRCPSGVPRPHGCEYYYIECWPGCSLHGDEVHHLWGRRQSAQVPHRHDGRHHRPGWM